nr:DUF1214 domain-containing protein [Nocardia yunnanensis]
MSPDLKAVAFDAYRSPGPERESNWLPAPTGPFQVMLRIYSPHGELLRGELAIPPLRKNL